MKKLNVKEKEKLINIMPSLKKETIMYVIRTLPIDFVRELALNETDDAVIEVVLKRLDEEKTQDVVINSYMGLSNAYHFKIRNFVVKEADIEIVRQMAMTEVKYEVVETIVERFNKERNNKKLKEYYENLATASHFKIRNFVAKEAPFEIVCKMAIKYEVDPVLESMVERLSISKANFKNNCYNLHKSINVDVREIIAEVADIDIICQMAMSETSDYMLNIVRKRLEENKESEVVKNNCVKLANVNNWIISEFAVLNASIEQLCDIAINTNNLKIDFLLQEKLEEHKEDEVIKNNYEKLSKSKYWMVRNFIAKEAPFETICKMAITEEKDLVISTMYFRINENLGSDVLKKYYNEFAKAISPVIRIFAIKEVSIDVICEMINQNAGEDVLFKILERLKLEKQNTNMLKKCYEKLLNINNDRLITDVIEQAPIEVLCENSRYEEIHWLFMYAIINRLKNIKDTDVVKKYYANFVLSRNKDMRKFVADELPIEYVCDLAMAENEGEVVRSILKRFKANECEDILKEHYKDFIKAKSASIREFVVDKLSIELVCDMAMFEIESNVIDSILSRLNKEKYEDSLNEIYGRLLDAENYKIKSFAINTLPLEYVKKHIVNIEDEDVLLQVTKILN